MLLCARSLLGERFIRHRDTGGVSYSIEEEDASIYDVIAAPEYREDLLEYFGQGELLPVAHYYVVDQVNKHLRGHVNLAVLHSDNPTDDGRLRFSPSDLLAAIYVHFAMELAGARGHGA